MDLDFENLLKISPPKRPGLGNKGQRIRVRTNYLEIKSLPENTTVHHYDVTIKPPSAPRPPIKSDEPRLPPKLNRKIFEQFVKTFREDLGGIKPVYDGSNNMFTNKELPLRNDSGRFDVTLQEENTTVTSRRPPRIFKVELKKVNEINLDILKKFINAESKLTKDCRTAIMALDILIGYKMSVKHTTIRRSFYTPEGARPIFGGLEAWQGYYQSARPTFGKMLINVDLSATAFYASGPLIGLVTKILKKSPDSLQRYMPEEDFNKLGKFIKGLQIKDNHRPGNKRRFKITGLSKASPSQITFMKDGVETNVKDYFLREYRVRLEYPNLPCVKIKDIYLPMEVCDVIEGQRYPRKLTSRQTSEMMDFTRQNPTMRENKIYDGIGILNYGRNENLQQFGIRVSNDMITVNARILPTPTVKYHPSSREANIVPRDGAWNLRDKRVAAGTTLGSWAVLSFAKEREQIIKKFIRELIETCQNTGMNIPNTNPPILFGNVLNPEEELKKAWVSAGNNAKAYPQLILCILPSESKEFYAEIKRVTDTVIGVASQCIQSEYIEKPKKQYCANVCLKINVKLGGMNSYIDPVDIKFITEDPDEPTIVMGADVTHPKRDTKGPSISALCASMDAKASRYFATIRTQDAKLEIMSGLMGMVKEALKTFYQTCGRKPYRILFYRDGVSESQFKEVLEAEVRAIRDACRSLEAGYKPKITFVVVQKRHHTRFFPLGRRDSDRSGNCLPGTVVETGITHPFEFDFYLQSHAGILGTSRPAHYHVLFDQNGFNADSLQTLSYNLCFSYARCTRSVSLIPPVYYANLVCARARLHSKSGHDWSDAESSEASEVSEPVFGEVKQELQRVMYYM